MKDGGAEVVERRPLVLQASGSNPVMSGFCLWDLAHKRREYWLILQDADIQRDYYKLKACLAIDVK